MAGKTTNLERVYLNAPPKRRGKLASIATEGERTLFFDYMPLDLGMINGLRVKLAVYTVPGQALYAATRRTVLQGVDGIVFVADSDPERLDECVSSLSELERILPSVRGRELRDMPLVFQWNKRDLAEALSESDMGSRLNPWAKEAVAAVANEGSGVLETLRAVAQSTLKDCRKQLGIRADSSSVSRPARRRTSRRLRKLRAQRVAELRVPIVQASGGAHSSEAQTLPYGRRRLRGDMGESLPATRARGKARPIHTPIPPQTLTLRAPTPSEHETVLLRIPPDPEPSAKHARPSGPRKPASARHEQVESEAPSRPASAKLRKQSSEPRRPASAKLRKPSSEPRRPESAKLRRQSSEPRRPESAKLRKPSSEPRRPASAKLRKPGSGPQESERPSPRIPATVSGGSGVLEFADLVSSEDADSIRDLRTSAARFMDLESNEVVSDSVDSVQPPALEREDSAAAREEKGPSRDELCPWSSVSQVLPPRLDPVIGRTVGAWRINAKLGEGGMGAVYLARHPRLRKEVVVKVLKPELAHRPRRVERFLREARLGARLSHPNLVSVQDVGTTECGLHYMVMEYVEGQNLHERIQAKGPQSPREALRIVTEVAKALSVLHEAGVIHRDVKTENVVITPDGVVKLIDFGLAKDLSDGDQLTLPGAMIGTPVYMAPEIGRVREVDHRVDIYSLGLTWYCLLTGEQPFAGHDVHRVILGKVPLPKPLASTGDALDPRTQNVLARMLAWHREERHPTLEGVLSDLAALTRPPETKAAVPDRWALTRPQKARPKPAPVAEEPEELPRPYPETDPRLLLLGFLQLGLSLFAIALATIALLN